MVYFTGLMTMELSEEVKDKVATYIDLFVDSQPNWLKKLFEEELVCFYLKDEGFLDWMVHKSFSDKKKRKIACRIHKYLEEHPMPFLKIELLH